MQHGTAEGLGRLHQRVTNEGGMLCPAEHIRPSRTARPSISKKAMRSAAFPRRKRKAGPGPRSTSRTKAARTPATAASRAAAPPPRKVGRPGAGTARAERPPGLISALEDFDRPFERPQLAVRQALHLALQRCTAGDARRQPVAPVLGQPEREAAAVVGI